MNSIVILLGIVFIVAALIPWIRTGNKAEDEIRVIDTPGAHVEYRVTHYEKCGVWLFVVGILFTVLGPSRHSARFNAGSEILGIP